MIAIRRLIRYGIWSIGALVLIVAIAIGGAMTPAGRRVLLNYALQRSQSVLAAELSIGRLSGTLFTRSRLEDVTVRLDGKPVISAAAIEVDYSLRDLLARRFRITRLDLIQPRILLERTPEGWNLSRLLRKRENGRPVAFKIEDFKIQDGTLTLLNGPPNVGAIRVPTTFANVDMTCLFERQSDQTTLDITKLSLQGHNPGLTIKQLSGRIVSRPRDLVFHAVHLETAQSALVLDGRVDYARPREDS